MDDISERVLDAFFAKGDLAHLALFLWASGASSLLVWVMKQLAGMNERFARFTAEIARFNQIVGQTFGQTLAHALEHASRAQEQAMDTVKSAADMSHTARE